MYYYSIAVATNYQKLRDLNQHKFVNLQFWRSQRWDSLGSNQDTRRSAFLSGSPKDKAVSLPFPFSRRCLHSGFRLFFSILKAGNTVLLWPFFLSYYSFWIFLLPSSTFKDSDYIGLTWIMQDNFPVFRSPG